MRPSLSQHPHDPASPFLHPSTPASFPQNRMATDPRHRGPLPVPPPGPGPHLQNGHARPVHPIPPSFDLARSPPNPPPAKNTKHVPCKFFRQGACQAGPACPFLHSTDAAVDSAPCKYFTKGNCKFGAKCALAHILPDGRRVNRPNFGLGLGGGNLNLGGRVNPPPYHAQDSLLSQQRMMNGHGPRYPYHFGAPPEDLPPMMHGQPQPQQQQPPPPPPPPAAAPAAQSQPQPQQYNGIPIIRNDTTGLVPDAKFGSPSDENKFPMSPIGRTALDAPLPASFDSQGISYIARHGPVAASVPSKFGLDFSPPPSQRPGATPDVLRSLHDTAFGSDSKSALASSPFDEGSGLRLMHSQRFAKPKMLSASVPRPSVLDEWDESFLEEDFVPSSLHDDVLTPQERMRRLSRTEQDRDLGFGSAKVGSPLGSSPSRFSTLFAKQRQKKEEEAQVAGLGHVGSPLRESSLPPRSSPSTRPIGSSRPGSGDISPFVASPSGRQPSSLSMISQQLSSMSLHPNSATRAGPSSRFERAVSSPVSTTRIDEEQEGEGDLVFSMEEEEKENNNSNDNNNNNDKQTSTNTSAE
ncbi:hypothetical protein VTO42DRAFT_4314 [Malbranchea cinnamomea]